MPANSKNKKSGKGKTEIPVAYEIEAFADVSEDGKVYLVKWKGYKQQTWESVKSLKKQLSPSLYASCLDTLSRSTRKRIARQSPKKPAAPKRAKVVHASAAKAASESAVSARDQRSKRRVSSTELPAARRGVAPKVAAQVAAQVDPRPLKAAANDAPKAKATAKATPEPRTTLSPEFLTEDRIVIRKLQLDKPAYPLAPRDAELVEDHHGVEVADPYRCLEDPKAAVTKRFVDDQNAFYGEVTAPLNHLRDQITTKMTELYDYGKTSCFRRVGVQIIYEHNTGLQPQNVVCIQSDLGEPRRVLLDPNTWSVDGTVALRGRFFSRSGTIMSYGVSDAGSDWTTLRFINTITGKPLDDVISECKFTSQAWFGDEGLFYNRYLTGAGEQVGTATESNQNQKLYYHRLGTPQSEDVLVWEDPDQPEHIVGASVTHDDKYLVLSIKKGCKPENLLWVVPLTGDMAAVSTSWVKVVNVFTAEFHYVSNDGVAFVLSTTYKAPMKRVMRIKNVLSADAGDSTTWGEVIPEDRKNPIESVMAVGGDRLLIEFMQDVKSALKLFSLTTGNHLGDIPVPIGTITSIHGGRWSNELFVSLSSFLEPGVIYRIVNIRESLDITVVDRTTLGSEGGLDLNGFETKQIFYKSKDGTEVPMFVVNRKGIELDGSHPVRLYGYGGFNISLRPAFNLANLLWVRHFGGVYAVSNIRGGGEYGSQWHKGGCCNTKQNCFDDFQWAAKELIVQGYTEPERIGIAGGSNGGLLVCTCANQAPKFFGAAISKVGVLDILRFHKFTIGHAWTSDFGNPDVPADFNVALKYSPVHNVRVPPPAAAAASLKWQYPSMLLTTADHDDRVSPLHSLKMVAELQHTAGGSTGQTNPLLLKVDTNAGHGAGKSTQKRIEDTAHDFAFMSNAIGAIWSD